MRNIRAWECCGDLLHRQRAAAFGHAGRQGIDKRSEAKMVGPHIARRLVKYKALNIDLKADAKFVKAEKLGLKIRIKLKYPFRVIKCQFGFMKVRCRGLIKKAQLILLFALPNR